MPGNDKPEAERRARERQNAQEDNELTLTSDPCADYVAFVWGHSSPQREKEILLKVK